jgi:hypothetical protein
MKSIILPLAILGAVPAALGQSRDDGWLNTVLNSPAYRQMPASATCARSCITNVDTVTGCTVYSCVCSSNTGGVNYVAGRDNISACALQKCSDPAVADVAVGVFNQICNEAAGISIMPPASASVTGADEGGAAPTVAPAAAKSK